MKVTCPNCQKANNDPEDGIAVICSSCHICHACASGIYGSCAGPACLWQGQPNRGYRTPLPRNEKKLRKLLEYEERISDVLEGLALPSAEDVISEGEELLDDMPKGGCYDELRRDLNEALNRAADEAMDS